MGLRPIVLDDVDAGFPTTRSRVSIASNSDSIRFANRLSVDKMDPMIHHFETPEGVTMLEHTVERLGRDTLCFSGRLVASPTTNRLVAGEDSRWLELALYETAEGGFVAGVKFCTSAVGETSVSMFELLDEIAGVENFFFAFEPDEFLQNAEMNLGSAARQRLASDLYSEYEVAVREVIAYTATRKESQRDGVDIQATETDGFVR